MSAILEDRHVAGSRLAEMLAELFDDVRARRVSVLQSDDRAIWMRLCNVGSRILDVVEAAVKLGDWRWVRIDADEKRVGPWHLTPRTPECDGRSHALLEESIWQHQRPPLRLIASLLASAWQSCERTGG